MCSNIANLVVGRVTFVTASALKQIRLRSRVEYHLMIVECLARQSLARLLHFIARHLLRRHDGKTRDRDMAEKYILAKPWIFRILSTAHHKAV